MEVGGSSLDEASLPLRRCLCGILGEGFAEGAFFFFYDGHLFR